MSKVADQYSEAPEEDLRRAEVLATRVVALDRDNPRCHFALGLVRRLQSRFDEAHNHLEAALRLNPCWNNAHAQIGWVKAFSGRAEEAWPHFAECIRLSPRDPRLFLGFFGFGWTRFLLGDDDEAIEMLRRAIALNPDYPPCHLGLAAAYGMQGRLDEARAALAAYLRCGTPTVSIALLRARSLSKLRSSSRNASGSTKGCAGRACRRNDHTRLSARGITMDTRRLPHRLYRKRRSSSPTVASPVPMMRSAARTLIGAEWPQPVRPWQPAENHSKSTKGR